MKSTHGRRGAICEHFGWTYDYLMHGISWPLVQKMMIDAPSYDFDDKGDDEIKLTQGNADNILNYVNSLI